MQITEKTPAEHFWDRHLLGNGKLGMAVKGDPMQDEIVLNEDTLWSGSESFSENPEHYEGLLKARQLVLEGKNEEANRVVEEKMFGRWSEGYLPMARLRLMTGMGNGHRNQALRRSWDEAVPEDYRRSLSLEDAVETVQWRDHGISCRREYFVSAVTGEGYIFCTAQAQDANDRKLVLAAAVESQLLSETEVSDRKILITGRAPDHTEPEYTPVSPACVYLPEEKSNALRFACEIRVLGTDGTLHSDSERIYIANASYVLLAVRALTNYRGYGKTRDKDVSNLKHMLQKSWSREEINESEDYRRIKEEHILEYRKLYNRVELELPKEENMNLCFSERLKANTDESDDPALAALILQCARYLVISASRPGSQAMNLQGIWNDRLNPPWASNYTTNINLEMNYWPCELLGLSECHMPFFDLIRNLSDAGRKTAGEYYHMNGWVVHHNTDFWCNTQPACEDARWSWWPMAPAWLCSHIRSHFAYSQDVKFLEEMYPVLRGAVLFYLDFLTEDEDGFYVTAPSVSPENAPLMEQPGREEKAVAVTKACTMDRELLTDLFADFIFCAVFLQKEDALIAEAEKRLKKLRPWSIGKYGQLQEWSEDYKEATPGNPHTSHLYGVYPSALITPETTPELAAAARRSLERRILHLKQQNGWGASWKTALAARLKNPFLCSLMLKQLYACLGAGLLTKNGQQIDAVLGAGAAIGEMLLQSHNGYLELLPSLPGDWNRGSYRGLRARGGFEVSAKWESGRIQEAFVTSLNGNRCRVKNAKRVVCDGRDVEISVYSQIAEFDTQKGERYRLFF